MLILMFCSCTHCDPKSAFLELPKKKRRHSQPGQADTKGGARLALTPKAAGPTSPKSGPSPRNRSQSATSSAGFARRLGAVTGPPFSHSRPPPSTSREFPGPSGACSNTGQGSQVLSLSPSNRCPAGRLLLLGGLCWLLSQPHTQPVDIFVLRLLTCPTPRPSP